MNLLNSKNMPDGCDVTTRTVDLVMFTKEESKRDQSPLCLIEFKRHCDIFGDIEKLRRSLS